MKIETKFDMGDRVTDGHMTGEIAAIFPGVTVSGSSIYYRIHLEAGHADNFMERMEANLTLAPKKLTLEEAWVEVVVKFTEEISNLVGPGGGQSYVWEVDKSMMRHQAYTILGGSGVDCNKNHEELKARLNDLITRLENILGE